LEAAQERLRGKIGSLSQEMLEEIFEVVRARHAVRASLQRLRKLAAKNQAVLKQLNLIAAELDELIPVDFPGCYRRERIRALPRYLGALNIRAERAYTAPEKDRVKAEQAVPYAERYEQLKHEVKMKHSMERRSFLDELRWMIEEFKVSLFAPEIKVRGRISAKRLEEKFGEWGLWKDKE
jgi:ATP-dependent helicase HrpA